VDGRTYGRMDRRTAGRRTFDTHFIMSTRSRPNNEVSPKRDVTVLARRAVSAAGPSMRPVAGPAAVVHPRAQQRYRCEQTTPTDDSEQNNTGPLGGPVMM